MNKETGGHDTSTRTSRLYLSTGLEWITLFWWQHLLTCAGTFFYLLEDTAHPCLSISEDGFTIFYGDEELPISAMALDDNTFARWSDDSDDFKNDEICVKICKIIVSLCVCAGVWPSWGIWSQCEADITGRLRWTMGQSSGSALRTRTRRGTRTSEPTVPPGAWDTFSPRPGTKSAHRTASLCQLLQSVWSLSCKTVTHN